MASTAQMLKLSLALSAILTIGCSWTARAQEAIPFNYSFSGQDWPGVCPNGVRQSPVNIVTRLAAFGGRLPIQLFRLAYESQTTVTLLNTGHVIQVSVPSTSNNFLVTAQGRFRLTNFHFHAYGEHHIDGLNGPIEGHFVHTNGTAFQVIALLFKFDDLNADNSYLASFFSQIPKNTVDRITLTLSLSGLVYPPGSTAPDLSLYTYPGSLTAPPCTEAVTWYVLQRRANISVPQLKTALDAVAAVSYGVPSNNRLPQPLNGRTIVYRPVVQV